MYGTIDLYNLALTPNDTMYFDSVEAQTEWFNQQEHFTIYNISFNGSRAFRVGKNYLDVIFNYNYVRYQLNGRYVYAFIENIEYINDECSALNISIDLNQTFLNELQTAIVKSNVANTTEKDEYFKRYIPFTNKLSVNDYEAYKIGDFAYNVNYQGEPYYVGFIIMNLELPNTQNYRGYDRPDINIPIKELYTIESGYTYPFSTIIYPLFYNINEKRFVDVPFVIDYKLTKYPVSSISELLGKFGAYMVNANIGFSFTRFNFISSINYDFNNRRFDIGLITTSDVPSSPFNKYNYVAPFYTAPKEGETITQFILVVNNTPTLVPMNFNLSSRLNSIPLPLQRSPYCFVRIGSDTNYIDINLLDFYDSNYITSITNTLNIYAYTSCLYPFTTTFVFKFNGKEITDPNLYFNVNSSSPLPYSVSAWQNYFSTHSASVNDGLATQQKYERQQSQLQLTKGLVSGAMDIATSFVPFTKAGNLKKIAGASDKQLMSGVLGGAQSILNAGLDYANSELEREKQKALLEIEWNDIKSSPSEFGNIMTNFTNLLYNAGQVMQIHLYVAKNIEDIKAYHKQYGYQVNRMQSLPWNTIKKHTVFDYISFNEITIKSTLPQFYTAMIEQQFEQGVRFWYNYDNFMNFDIENTEVAE